MASLLHSLFVVNGLKTIDIDINLVQASQMILNDWLGLFPTYGIIIAVGLAISFTVIMLVINRFDINPAKHSILIATAGTCAIAVILITMKPIMNITLIAGARDYGFYAQLFSGLIGGIVFASVYKRKSKPEYL